MNSASRVRVDSTLVTAGIGARHTGVVVDSRCSRRLDLLCLLQVGDSLRFRDLPRLQGCERLLALLHEIRNGLVDSARFFGERGRMMRPKQPRNVAEDSAHYGNRSGRLGDQG